MSLKDFAKKHATITKRHGPITAATMASQEALLRAIEPLAQRKATPIWDAEWDVCLVLDATRFDLWREVVGVNGQHPTDITYWKDYLAANTESRYSVGSASMHWINETFKPEHRYSWQNAAYVTANPFSGKQGHELPNLDPDVYPLNERGLCYLDEVWQDEWPMSDELPTVDPAVLTDRAFWAYGNTDCDRLVVHYMQPHIPFKNKPDWFTDWGGTEYFAEPSEGNTDGKDIWMQLRDGELGEREVWKAYRENLEWVLDEVYRWYQETDARILITSDHGNAKGEFGQYSHPPFSANPYLRKVPWVTIEGVGDGKVASSAREPPQSRPESDVESRLDALGYR